MSRKYNYLRIFYHRPLLTTENLRFWSITTVILLCTLILTVLLTKWAERLPVQDISKKIKQNYVAYLMQQQPVEIPKMEKPSVMAGETSNFNARINPEIIKPKMKFDTTIFRIEPDKPTAFGEMLADNENSGVDFSRQAGKSIRYIEPITSAIEDIPGLISPEGLGGRREKQLIFSRTVESTRQRPKINIPKPEPVHFASENGNRDLYETTAVMEMNENDIRFCFEKFARFDPLANGDVLVSFTIHPDGYVIPASIKIVKSNITNPKILHCIRKNIERWKNFPKIALEEGKFTITRKYIY